MEIHSGIEGVEGIELYKTRRRKFLEDRLERLDKIETDPIKVLERRNENLTNQMLEAHADIRRFSEAALVDRPLAIGTGPNYRGYWENKELRDQSRFLYSNDPLAKHVVESIVANVIGTGIMPSCETSSPELKQIMTRVIHYLMNGTSCDYDGIHNLVGLQRQALRSIVRDGDTFLKFNITDTGLKFQLLEIDYLDVTRQGLVGQGDNPVINGIEFDKKMQNVLAYWVYPYHPEDYGNQYGYQGGISIVGPSSITPGTLASVRVPAGTLNHIRKIERTGQKLGKPWMEPAMIKFWDLREYEEAKLKQQKLQASFTAFVQDNYQLSEDERFDLIGDPKARSLGIRTVTPGHIENVPMGKEIVFPHPSQTQNEAFVERCQRYIAGSMGISYEVVSQDYSKVNFSSGRMGFLEMDRTMKSVVSDILEPQFLQPIAKTLLRFLAASKIIPEDHDITISWTPPAREMIDPVAESQALANMVSYNFISQRRAMASIGIDMDRELADIAESREKMAAVGLSPLVPFGGSTTKEDLASVNKPGGGKSDDNGSGNSDDQSGNSGGESGY